MKAKQVIVMAVLASGISAFADSGFDVSRYNSRLAVLGQNRLVTGVEGMGAAGISSRAAVVQPGERGMVAHFEPAIAGSQYNSKLAAIGRGTVPTFEIAPLAPAKECGPDCSAPCCVEK